MLDVETALVRILDRVAPLESIQSSLFQGLHHFAAEPVYASIPLPGFDNSAMDGYAVQAADTVSGGLISIIDEQPAGISKHLRLQQGQAIRIFTGAPMPAGADAVIMQEDVELSDDKRSIRCREPVVMGENIRLAGSDLCLGQLVLSRGQPLTPTRLALLASQGLAEVSVTCAPRIAIVTTGDELVEAGIPLQPGQLYNSNQLLLQSLVAQCGVPGAFITLHHLPDDLEETIDTLDELTEAFDFIILSGGVSVGDHDHIKPALLELGHEPHFWRVKIKPGKPLLHTVAEPGPCHIFGLPGNPVSSFVTFMLFVRPALLKAMGADANALELPRVEAMLREDVSNTGDRPHYLRGTFSSSEQSFIPSGVQQSHALFGLSQANALLRIEPNQSLSAGTRVSLLLT